MSGKRVGCYLHQDGLKGGCMVQVLTTTDFAARTDEVAAFVKRAAQLAFGAQAETPEELWEMFPDFKEEADALTEELGEQLVISNMKLIT